MQNTVKLEVDPVSLADDLLPLIKNHLDLGDGAEVDQQPPPLSTQQLPTRTAHSLLETEIDPNAIESLELVLNSVVKVFCTSTPCNFYLPW